GDIGAHDPAMRRQGAGEKVAVAAIVGEAMHADHDAVARWITPVRIEEAVKTARNDAEGMIGGDQAAGWCLRHFEGSRCSHGVSGIPESARYQGLSDGSFTLPLTPTTPRATEMLFVPRIRLRRPESCDSGDTSTSPLPLIGPELSLRLR